MNSLRIVDIIEKKANGHSLSDTEIGTFIRAVNDKKVDEAQIGSFLMSVRLNDMNDDECASLTAHMSTYGDRLSWGQDWASQVIDKHSTGGVGDKISLILAPAVAACGGKVPMISGRGLGFTGGTLDKLEAIPGFTVEMPLDKMRTNVENVGVFIAGQTPDIAPVDKKLYSIRDVTATVHSDPLIASSIMSKKSVEGITGLILDVKVGKAALMKTTAEAKTLALKMVQVGEKVGIKTVAILTKMDHPIGYAVGNALEVADAFQGLNNNMSADQRELVETEGGMLLYMAKLAESPAEGKEKIRSVIADGRALTKFKEMLIAQGVEETLANRLCTKEQYAPDHYLELMGQKSAKTTDIKAKESGIITDIDTLGIAELTMELGAGRRSKNDKLDYAVGIYFFKKVGDRVVEGDVWGKVYHQSPLSEKHVNKLETCLTIEEHSNFKQTSLVLDTLSSNNH